MTADAILPLAPVTPLEAERRQALLEALLGVARRAGTEIMRVYESDFAVRGKADDSPVTEADERAERVILAHLAALAPDIPAVSEEACSKDGLPPPTARFWLVDPLDGTREFVKRNGEFTVNIALIENGAPVLGVVYIPALDDLYFGGEGLGAYRENGREYPLKDGGARHAIHARRPPAEGLIALASASHGDEAALQAFLAKDGRKVAGIQRCGSSLKLCRIAAGEADLYPRLGRTMEWDIAAGHAVLRAAGGRVRTLDGSELGYGKPGYENPHFVASGAA
ncbi:MAG TPA: 3'(2'),5'-bisphosphate nucleotidase CysQ [Burkholderiales bacterium]|nr:3'(2'),5'-bisphosphate nucleotidase CysQ [Burkholderiales bacterium]